MGDTGTPLEVIALNRLAFGPRPSDWAAFQALGNTPEERLNAFLEQQLNPDTVDDSACDARLAAQNFRTLHKPLETLWQDHFVNGDSPPADFTGSAWEWRTLPVREAEAATFIRALYSERQLLEVMVKFWHHHFNVYAWDYWIGPTFVHYDRDVIRAHALGNFRELLGAVAKSPAMLFYLDNATSSRAGPNENYARELFELHTLGAEHYLGVRRQEMVPGYPDAPVGYVDDDVYEATRCLTGWRVADGRWNAPSTGQFYYDDTWHDRFRKLVLGRYMPPDRGIEDGEEVLDVLATHPGTARHIARKLCRRLVSDTPPESLVQQAADVFLSTRDRPDQIKAVVRTIVQSEAFRTTWGEKIKRPFELAVSAMRAVQADLTDFTPSFRWWYGQMGQPLFAWRPPNGYPDVAAPWTGSASMLHRWRFTNRLFLGMDGVQVDVLSQTPADVKTPNALVDFWTQRVLGRPPAESTRRELVDFIAQGRNPDLPLPDDERTARLPHMVALMLMSPDFQWR